MTRTPGLVGGCSEDSVKLGGMATLPRHYIADTEEEFPWLVWRCVLCGDRAPSGLLPPYPACLWRAAGVLYFAEVSRRERKYRSAWRQFGFAIYIPTLFGYIVLFFDLLWVY